MIRDTISLFDSVARSMPKIHRAYASMGNVHRELLAKSIFLDRRPTSLFQVLHNRFRWNADSTRDTHFQTPSVDLSIDGQNRHEVQSRLEKWEQAKARVSWTFVFASALRPEPGYLANKPIVDIGNVGQRIVSLFLLEESGRAIAVACKGTADSGSRRQNITATVSLFDLDSGIEEFPQMSLDCFIVSCDLAPNGRTLVLGGDNGLVHVVDVQAWNVISTFDSGHGVVGRKKINVKPASESRGFDFNDWKNPLNDPEIRRTFEQSQRHEASVRGEPWSTDYLDEFERDDSDIRHVVWDMKSDWFGTIARDGLLKIWNSLTFRLVEQIDLSAHPKDTGSFVDGAAINGQPLMFICKGGHLIAWDVQKPKVKLHVEVDTKTGWSHRNGFALSSDGRRLGVVGSNSRLTLFETETLTQLWAVDDSKLQRVNAMCFAADDELLCIGTGTGGIFIVDAETGAIVHECPAFVPSSVSAIRCTDKVLIVGCQDGLVKAIELETLLQSNMLKGHSTGITDWASIPKRGMLITAARDGTAFVWDNENLANPVSLNGHTEQIDSVSISHDQKLAVSGGYDGVMIWGIDSGERLSSLSTATNVGVAEAIFSPDGQFVAACGNIYVWVWRTDNDGIYPIHTFSARPMEIPYSDDCRTVTELVFDPTSRFLFALNYGMAFDGWRVEDGSPNADGHSIPKDAEGKWKQAKQPPKDWTREFTLLTFDDDIAVVCDGKIVAWWPGPKARIAEIAKNRFAVWKGGSTLEFVELIEFSTQDKP